MNKRRWMKRTMAFMAAGILALVGNVQAIMADSDTITIGLSIPITGALAESGEQAVNAAELACREINEAGGIDGRKVEYLALDDKMDSTEAAMCAQRFTENEDIVAVIGSLTSGTTLAVLPIYEDAGMPVICPTGNNDDLSGYNNFIRIVMAASKEAPMVGAMVMNNLEASKVGVIYDNSDYGNTMVSASAEVVEKLGGEIVASEAYTAGTDKDFSVQLSKMLQMEADTIIIVGDYNEGSLIISQAETMGGFENVKWAGDSYLLGDVLLERVGDSPLAANIYAACDYNPFSDTENHKRFAEAYQKEYGLIPSEPAGFTYDAFTVIFDALKAGANKENLIDTIKSMEFTNLVCSDFVKFDDNGNRVGSGNEIVIVNDGQFSPKGETVDTTGLDE
ncbi:ABC transporter substrate-binding protein [Blautia schinkii]|nr:ABC transporter substrate-binding protein [Blautia schinkii]